MRHSLEMLQRLDNDFAYHAPVGDRAVNQDKVRNMCRQLSRNLGELVPPGSEMDMALAKVREVMMWACAGIDCAPQEKGD
jgi:biotin carboxylase